MAKLMVCIDFPDISYYDMRQRLKAENRVKEKIRKDGFFNRADGDKVLVADLDLERSQHDDACYVFELIGCKPS